MPPLPPCDRNSRSGSPSRARLSLLTFFGKTKKVSRPRQGTKQREPVRFLVCRGHETIPKGTP
ncbi:MAG: hypothetical protein C0465_08990 [Ralstonia sp.]|nr:hypothetical protein [Ralstonia sp.]MBA4230738.1 hypothetical protein [Ralstonia sp.]MBA4238987.1 hypothetical protein [Ralstonia sp.]MBA4402389.1 hypothetical protein [Ralstonia sp.]POH87676.1 hypothetical protein CJ026_012675 [Ralstonia pickettii]